jgi:5'-nucleotidase
MQKRILVTNDDGFESEGLRALVEALRPLGQITVVAPTTEKSACGHSLTLTRPLRFVQIEDDFFKLDDGTPSDCIYLAKYALFENDKLPDLVVSGINYGSNMGEDITYSGTASAAMEAVLQGIPAIAISLVYSDGGNSVQKYGYELAQQYAHDIAKKILEGGFPLGERRFLNINIPPIKKEDCKGVKITQAGYKMYGNDAHLHRNPRGQEYYWIGAHVLEWEASKNAACDLSAIDQNYISITPVKLDMTAHDEIQKLNEWLHNG